MTNFAHLCTIRISETPQPILSFHTLAKRTCKTSCGRRTLAAPSSGRSPADRKPRRATRRSPRRRRRAARPSRLSDDTLERLHTRILATGCQNRNLPKFRLGTAKGTVFVRSCTKAFLKYDGCTNQHLTQFEIEPKAEFPEKMRHTCKNEAFATSMKKY